jgi:hypothetical protein
MFMSVQEFSSAMKVGEIDPSVIKKIQEIIEKKGADYILVDESQIIELVEKINKTKTKDQIKQEIAEKCKNFKKITKDTLMIVVLAMVLSAALGIAFNFGFSLLGSKEPDKSVPSSEPMAQA